MPSKRTLRVNDAAARIAALDPRRHQHAFQNRRNLAFGATRRSGRNGPLSRQATGFGNDRHGQRRQVSVLVVVILPLNGGFPCREFLRSGPAAAKDGIVCLLLIDHGVVLDDRKIPSPHEQEREHVLAGLPQILPRVSIFVTEGHGDGSIVLAERLPVHDDSTSEQVILGQRRPRIATRSALVAEHDKTLVVLLTHPRCHRWIHLVKDG